MNALANGTSPVIHTYALAYRPPPLHVQFRVRSFCGLQTVKGRFL
jgi:hypothetical protein